MSDKKKYKEDYESRFSRDVESKSKRIIKGREQKKFDVLFGLGMFGLIGWSVALPTVAGGLIGLWIDLTWESGYSWTLMLIIAGLAIGSLNAWFWIKKESRGEE
jgi:ATP synthase protein I